MNRWVDEKMNRWADRGRDTQREGNKEKIMTFQPPNRCPIFETSTTALCAVLLVLVFGVPPRPTRWVWTSCWRPFTADVAEVLWIDGWMAGYIIDYILYIYVHASLICHIHYSGDFWRNSSNIHQYIFVVHAFTQFHCSLYTSETWALTCCKHSPLLS